MARQSEDVMTQSVQAPRTTMLAETSWESIPARTWKEAVGIFCCLLGPAHQFSLPTQERVLEHDCALLS
jgi:hypothetical protein